jgi:MFS superfamily sulfate permease-like transporter
MAIIYFLPKFSKVVPEILEAVIVGSLAVIWHGLDTRAVGHIASIKGGIPALHIPEEASTSREEEAASGTKASATVSPDKISFFGLIEMYLLIREKSIFPSLY